MWFKQCISLPTTSSLSESDGPQVNKSPWGTTQKLNWIRAHACTFSLSLFTELRTSFQLNWTKNLFIVQWIDSKQNLKLVPGGFHCSFYFIFSECTDYIVFSLLLFNFWTKTDCSLIGLNNQILCFGSYSNYVKLPFLLFPCSRFQLYW